MKMKKADKAFLAVIAIVILIGFISFILNNILFCIILTLVFVLAISITLVSVEENRKGRKNGS